MEGNFFVIFIFFLSNLTNFNFGFQMSQRAQQVASQLKPCVAVTPGENMDYLDSFPGEWYVVKLYDAPAQHQQNIPKLNVLKDEDTGDFIGTGSVPGELK